MITKNCYALKDPNFVGALVFSCCILQQVFEIIWNDHVKNLVSYSRPAIISGRIWHALSFFIYRSFSKVI